ncbi:MAG: dipeptide ABC transporter ATP-binding protein DppD, partial [Deltaproteobacteria bacterium]
MAERELLSVRGLKTYFFTRRGVVKAVDGVDLSLDEGKTLGLVGESGCGKSVTALSILRLVPRPRGKIVGGEIRYQGRNLLDFPEEEMRRIRGGEIGMVFQEPLTSLNPVFSIGEHLLEAITVHHRMSRREAKERAIELLSAVGFPDPALRLKNYPHQLSGGMRQRVMIAIALAGEPRVLIADEPTTALDVTIQAQILDLIQRLKEERGLSVIFITHNLGIVASFADEVAVMYAGRIVERAEVEAIFH